MYRLEFDRAGPNNDLLDDLRAVEATQPFLDIDVDADRVVILLRGDHLAEIIDRLNGVEFVVEPAGSSRRRNSRVSESE